MPSKFVPQATTLQVIPIGLQTSLTVSAGVFSDNQLNLPYSGKFVYSFQASSPVELTLWGPFPGGFVDSQKKIGLGKMKLDGTSMTVGNTETVGAFLLEISSPTLATVNLIVRPWGFFDNVLQFVWKITNH